MNAVSNEIACFQMQYSQFNCDPFTKLPFSMVPKWAVNWVLVAYDLRRFENKESYYAFRWTDLNRTICFWNKLNLSKNMKAKMILSPHSIRSKLDIKLSWALDIWSRFSIKKFVEWVAIENVAPNGGILVVRFLVAVSSKCDRFNKKLRLAREI